MELRGPPVPPPMSEVDIHLLLTGTHACVVQIDVEIRIHVDAALDGVYVLRDGLEGDDW